jgi:hypothetical protein
MDDHLLMFMIGCGVKTYYNHQQKKWVANFTKNKLSECCVNFVLFSGSGNSITEAVKDLYINYLDNNSD